MYSIFTTMVIPTRDDKSDTKTGADWMYDVTLHVAKHCLVKLTLFLQHVQIKH